MTIITAVIQNEYTNHIYWHIIQVDDIFKFKISTSNGGLLNGFDIGLVISNVDF